MFFSFSGQKGAISFAMVGVFSVTVMLASCGRSSENVSRTKSVAHSYSVEPHPTDANLWVVLCKDGTREIRTINEVRRDSLCRPGPKFVTTQRTILTVETSILLPGEITRTTQNCVLPEGAVLESWLVEVAPSGGTYRFHGGLNSEIAIDCEKIVGGLILENGESHSARVSPTQPPSSDGPIGRFPYQALVVFADKVAYRPYDASIYGPETTPYPCPVETETNPLPLPTPNDDGNPPAQSSGWPPCDTTEATPVPSPTTVGTFVPR